MRRLQAQRQQEALGTRARTRREVTVQASSILRNSPAALDPVLVGEVLGVIREMRGLGMTMVIATHEMGFAREIADSVCFLDRGRILELGPPEQIFTAPEHVETQDFLARVIAAGRL